MALPAQSPTTVTDLQAHVAAAAADGRLTQVYPGVYHISFEFIDELAALADSDPALQAELDTIMDAFAKDSLCDDRADASIQAQVYAEEYTALYIVRQIGQDAFDNGDYDFQVYKPIYDHAHMMGRAMAGDPTAVELYEAHQAYAAGHERRLQIERVMLEGQGNRRDFTLSAELPAGS